MACHACWQSAEKQAPVPAKAVHLLPLQDIKLMLAVHRIPTQQSYME